MPLRLNGAESGYVELSAPAIAGNNNIVLPTTGTVVTTDASQTLTNKTITGASVSTTNINSSSITNTTVSNATITGSTIITRATAVTASGTAIDFTGIPSWVKRITVMMNGTSLNATTPFLIQLGTSGGVVSSGYTSYWGYAYSPGTGTISGTTGFGIHCGSGTELIWTNVMITNVTENIWLASHSGALVTAPGGTGVMITGGGTVTLSTTLDRVRITSVSGTASYDAGTVNLLYEG